MAWVEETGRTVTSGGAGSPLSIPFGPRLTTPVAPGFLATVGGHWCEPSTAHRRTRWKRRVFVCPPGDSVIVDGHPHGSSPSAGSATAPCARLLKRAAPR